MGTVKTEITNEVVFDERKEHRYLLVRNWDKNKPIATIVTKSAGLADGINLDLTTSIITNNLYELGYGGFYAVNLVSAVNMNNPTLFDAQTDKIIKQVSCLSDNIIIAWGCLKSNSEVMKKREKEVLKMLKAAKKPILTITNGLQMNVHPLHPSVRKCFELVEYSK